ncbi:hypothetical protein GCM10011506_34120 [Marivirga lumbricoides]|uniref:Uncharacterized protein n=1 Tax=Marivirga lumbricoides TaxID=1046115 RepID=A0ABQ1MRM4_9BACT|nr:hypothetical protein GCM10011506_34120 [Marivirga lumbricoides]
MAKSDFTSMLDQEALTLNKKANIDWIERLNFQKQLYNKFTEKNDFTVEKYQEIRSIGPIQYFEKEYLKELTKDGGGEINGRKVSEEALLQLYPIPNERKIAMLKYEDEAKLLVNISNRRRIHFDCIEVRNGKFILNEEKLNTHYTVTLKTANQQFAYDAIIRIAESCKELQDMGLNISGAARLSIGRMNPFRETLGSKNKNLLNEADKLNILKRLLSDV